MTTYKPTIEQQAVIDACAAGDNLVVEAGAGAGKTSTLRLAAAQMPGRILYVAYNKAAAKEAAASFPSHVRCSTVHGLAFGAVGKHYAGRLNAPRQSAKDTARLLGINNPVPIGESLIVAPTHIARLALGAVKKFCQSSSDELGLEHLTALPGMPTAAELGRWHRQIPQLRAAGDHTQAAELYALWSTHIHARQEMAAVVLPAARKAWADLQDPRGVVRFEHDHYLKMWQLSRPELPYDVVMLDEAQDSNPCRSSLITRQDCQRIAIGDGCQQLYAWQGAVDALATWPADTRLYLTQSWRFGETVAREANKWLGILGAKLRVRGNPGLPTTIDSLSTPDAILCRSNAGAVARVLRALDAGQRPALVGGAKDIVSLAQAAADLQAGQPTSHPELFTFKTWGQVQEYAGEEAGADLKVFVDLIDEHKPQKIITALSQTVENEDQADVVISTAHKSKGREWDRVLIHDDFHEPKPDDDGNPGDIQPAEAMLAYVAVTRARLTLDRGGLAWVDKHVSPAALVGVA